MVPAHSHKVSRVSWYSGSCSVSSAFTYGAFTLCGRLSQNRSVSFRESLRQSVTPECTHSGLGSSAFARRYLQNRVFFLFLRVLRCFSSGGSLDTPILKFSVTYLSMNPGEFPHSEIPGSMLICSSPRLIAAYHVFHRLPVPRHSPCALVRLTFQTFFQEHLVSS